jgi:sec-independent protein translocase protein TatB
MFDFGLGSFELLMIAIVAIIVVGPKDLPKLLRTVGQFMTKVGGLAREFQGYLDDAARESGLDDVKSEVSKMTNFNVNEPTSSSTPPATSGTSAVASAKKEEKSSSEAKPAAVKPASKEPKAAKKAPTKKPAAKKKAASKPKKTKQHA